jgi:hypothetical protein
VRAVGRRDGGTEGRRDGWKDGGTEGRRREGRSQTEDESNEGIEDRRIEQDTATSGCHWVGRQRKWPED